MGLKTGFVEDFLENMSSGVPTGKGELVKSQFHVYGLWPLMQLQ
jgi:hypothetical protein